jgi:hypothetical protein
MKSLMIVARLKDGANEDARALLEQGPPYDLEAAGLDRHTAYLTASEVVFVFEAAEVEWIVNDIVDDPVMDAAFEPWRDLIDGPPRVAQEQFRWARGEEP